MTITIREPGSAITHLIGLLLAAFAAIPMLVKAALFSTRTAVAAMAVFMTSMILLYAASTLYHSVNLTGSKLKLFKKLDHMMIFVLIAGSYTPVCLLVLTPDAGYPLLIAVWGIAAAGMLFKLCWVTCPKYISSIIYVAMGWACLSVFGQLIHTLSHAAFSWLLAGGLFYTIGGIISRDFPSLCHGRKHLPFHLYVSVRAIALHSRALQLPPTLPRPPALSVRKTG